MKFRQYIAHLSDPGINIGPPLQNVQPGTSSVQPGNAPPVQYYILPILDETGKQVVFRQVARNLHAAPSIVPIQSLHHTPAAAELKQQKLKKSWRELSSFDLSNPAKLTSFVPLDPQPLSGTSLGAGAIATSILNMEGGEWDSWANGCFWDDVTHEEFTQTKNLGVHWATKNSSFRNGKGSVHSSTVDGAKVTAKKCLGVIACSNESCGAIFCPRVSPENLAKQQARLEYHPCESRSYLIRYGQIGNDISTLRYQYINGPPHSHSRIPDIAHTTAAEDKRFKAAYESCPKATPTQIMAGAPAPNGYGPGVAELGHEFHNQDYTGYLFGLIHGSVLHCNGLLQLPT
ncbi:hypothetical protein GYMLUDRAFT_251958 [Collybiopsis luxurians FD-317 M1]|uniref:Uncharacterized protein n=1 Tax=Collybiopsis luxurians FD-317 M1 TaxID=944289 RepID=A0A0D0AMY5_9AGAR|nr:hypothetical protein GYMLUDRAFT_251958 [Collybiopsis luxurians FD-317 M1]